MKYIKTFESAKGWDSYKFDKDDIVIAYDNQKIFYQIGNASPGWDDINRYELLRIKKINPIKLKYFPTVWVEEKELKKIEPEELELLFMATKYNL